MESLTAGTFVGAGSFRCENCAYALTIEGTEVLPSCPSCGGLVFLRASLFSTERISHGAEEPTHAALVQPAAPDLSVRLDHAPARLRAPGHYPVHEEDNELRAG